VGLSFLAFCTRVRGARIRWLVAGCFDVVKASFTALDQPEMLSSCAPAPPACPTVPRKILSSTAIAENDPQLTCSEHGPSHHRIATIT
jgi:hypothetical protein